MIAQVETKKKAGNYTNEQVNAKFMQLLPLIRQIASKAFKEYSTDRREDAVNDVIASAFINLKQLAEAGKLDEAYATPIAVFAVKRYRSGRRCGVPQSSTDVMAEHCRFLGRVKVHNFGLAEHIADTFESEATAVDARYPVHKTVQLKIDFFQTWFRQQTPRDQQIIRDLAIGETTGDAAKKYGVSAASISQYRRRYADSWYAFINPAEEIDLLEELKALVENES